MALIVTVIAGSAYARYIRAIAPVQDLLVTIWLKAHSLEPMSYIILTNHELT